MFPSNSYPGYVMPAMSIRPILTSVLLISLVVTATAGFAQQPDEAGKNKPAAGPEDCGSLQNAVGPFDYREAAEERAKGNLNQAGAAALIGIEQRFFTEDVEVLRDGNSARAIDSTLRAFPNHPRALWAAVRAERRNGEPKYGDPNRLSVSCYIHRALQLAPDDGLVWMLWGVFLHQHEQYHSAITKYRKALELGVESAELNYNLGLALLKVDDVQGALEQARIAYAQNYPLGGLKRKLIKLGVWK